MVGLTRRSDASTRAAVSAPARTREGYWDYSESGTRNRVLGVLGIGSYQPNDPFYTHERTHAHTATYAYVPQGGAEFAEDVLVGVDDRDLGIVGGCTTSMLFKASTR